MAIADLPIRAASDFSGAALCEGLNAAFSDYLIHISIPPEHWDLVLKSQGISIDDSFAIGEDDKVLALILVCKAGNRMRVATMGAVPEARGTGAAGRLMDKVTDEAKRRDGIKTLELECFAQNERAIRLYKSKGFTSVEVLHGYTSEPVGDAAAPESAAEALNVYAVSAESAIAWLEDARIAHLPLQVGPESMRALPESMFQVFRLGSAQLFSKPSSPNTLIINMIDTSPAQEDARALLRLFRAAHPEKKIFVPELQRTDLGGDALEAEGFERKNLYQELMVMSLSD